MRPPIVFTILVTTFIIRCNGSKSQTRSRSKPNIILILADDVGWNEVSWNNERIKTPNLERLSKDGVRLTRSYVTPKCSPSRAALMTGIYPFRMGHQRGAIERWQATGLNTSLRLLPEILNEEGYKTHMVGKWHLGYCHEAYLPQNRGFETFFGQYTHVTDYYTRKVNITEQFYPETEGHDLHDGDQPSFEGQNEFSTDLYTRKAIEVIEAHKHSKPLFLYLAFQAAHMKVQKPPKKYLNLYRKNGKIQQIYQDELIIEEGQEEQALYRAAAISAMDAGVQKIVNALKMADLYENSVIVFSTDNGGPTEASNFPFRGVKEQLYEGGIRGLAFVHSPLLEIKEKDNSRLMYITDWFSTLLHVANLDHKIPAGLDSFNMWPSISRRKDSPRKEIILNLDQDTFWNTWSAAIMVGKYKFIWGQSYLLKQRLEDENNQQQLYNLKRDPMERFNELRNSSRRPFTAALRDKLMNLFRNEMVDADYPVRYNAEANPALFGGALSPGWCKRKS